MATEINIITKKELSINITGKDVEKLYDIMIVIKDAGNIEQGLVNFAKNLHKEIRAGKLAISNEKDGSNDEIDVALMDIPPGFNMDELKKKRKT